MDERGADSLDDRGADSLVGATTPWSPDDLPGALARATAALRAAESQRDEKARLLRELELHQVELAAQNRELRAAEASCEEARQRYADLFERVPVACLTLDRRGCVREVNAAGRALLGDGEVTLVGKPFAAVARFEDPAAFWLHLRNCFESHAAVRTELRIAARGRIRTLSATSVQRAPASGGEATCHMALDDVTEMLEILERHRILIDGVSEYALVMLDAEGRIVTWNTGGTRLYGHRSEDIVGRLVSELHTSGDLAADAYAATLARAAARGRASFECWSVRADRTRFFAQIVITPVRHPSGQVRGFAKVTRDLSDRKRAEAVLRTALAKVGGGPATPRRLRSVQWVAAQMARWGASVGFTPAEMAAAQLAVLGLSNKEIARERKVSLATIRTQLSVCFRKAGATSRGEFTFQFFGAMAQDAADGDC